MRQATHWGSNTPGEVVEERLNSDIDCLCDSRSVHKATRLLCFQILSFHIIILFYVSKHSWIHQRRDLIRKP